MKLPNFLLNKVDKANNAFDKSIFKDQIALKMDWDIPKRGGNAATFKTHKIITTSDDKIVYLKKTGFFNAFLLIFSLMGICLIIFGYITIENYCKTENLIPIVIGIGFIITVLYIIFREGNVTFDKKIELFTKKGLTTYNEVKLKEIYALQLVTSWISMTNGGAKSVNLILVLKNTERISVCSFGGDVLQARIDAKLISEFLNVPLWDITGACFQ